MQLTIEADAEGKLILPVAVSPGARYTVEQIGESVTIRPAMSKAEIWWKSTTPEQRTTWLHEFVAAMPAGVGMKVEDVDREDLY